MFLNERKLKILEAIINDYIATAEPIGSRTIAKKYDLGISSATIRNEMSDLEEMGFIIQPHASSGRVPSDKGYRLYVDSLMHRRELTGDEADYLNKLVYDNISRIDYLMRESAKAIAMLTNYTTIVSEPRPVRTKIKHLQLIPLDENSVMLVVVTNSKAVRNMILRMQDVPGIEILSKISMILNKKLSNINIMEIDSILINDLAKDLGEFSYLCDPVIECVINTATQEDEIKIYTSGVKNILDFPEFSDLGKARALFHALEEKEMLITLLEGDSGRNIKIVIGTENNIKDMQDCSIIKANYNVGGQDYGSIGIIGPTRMDYPQVLAVLNGIVHNIDKVISNFL